MKKTYRTLRLVLGDQLNEQHSWFSKVDDETLYVLMECLSETGYVRHHIQKVVGFFGAMRHFAKALQKGGHEVHYIYLNDEANKQSIAANLTYLAEQFKVERLEYQQPDEYRLDEALAQLGEELAIPVEAVDSEHFLAPRNGVEEQFKGKKQYLLETFYRSMRKKYSILMEDDGDTPYTGRWNYDAENRKKLPKKIEIPPMIHFKRDMSSIVQLLEEMEVETIGKIEATAFDWPLTRQENLELLEHFLQHRFSKFGAYQDAMTDRDYLLFHSKLSFGMNTKQISPLEVVQAAERYWREHQEEVDIAQVEGFIRQILGWREYMRGIYWAKMPGYASLNYFEHQAPLPSYFWTGDTKMKCVGHAVSQSLDYAYAHHIQRLMVTGNFALLLGVHPDELDAWYLGIYMDAIEWVEITNTRGMSQFADGGIVGTKPYISSANYIHKMGDYCSNCQYDKKLKYGPNACPFNSLYWDFYDRHTEKLSKNPRVGMMYRVWNKMDGEEREKILAQAAEYKEHAEKL
ncbi:MAG: cryptochrome/photolyase family protein [Bacteroidota bacterium]